MRLSVMGFNQEKIINANLDITDVLILDYIIRANGNPSMKHIIEDEISYVWLSHNKIHEDLPILKIAEGTLKNKLYILKRDGWIQSVTKSYGQGKGSTAFYSVTIQCLNLLYNEEDFTGHSDVTPTGHSDVTSYNKLKDKELKDTISKDIVSADKSAKDIPIDNVIENKPKRKTRNRYEQLMDVVDDFTEDEHLRELLKEYAEIRLEISKEDGDIKTFYASKFKSIIKDLPNLSKDVNEQYKIVQQSIDGRWRKLFPLKKNNSWVGRQNKPNAGLQIAPSDAWAFNSKEEKEQYEENLRREYEKSGKRAVF